LQYTNQQQVYETLLYLLTPFILPISFYVRPSFCGYLLAATIVMYLINVIIFNEIHLRKKNERVGWTLLYVYYLPYKIVLTFINVASCYWSLYKYARYFAKRHPKVIEDEKAVEVVIRLEEEHAAKKGGLGRSLTVRTMTRPSRDDGRHEFDDDEDSIDPMDHMETSNGNYVMVTEPEHARAPNMASRPSQPTTPQLRNEGITAFDYFDAPHHGDSNAEKPGRRPSHAPRKIS
jgi:hypothetical protein